MRRSFLLLVAVALFCGCRWRTPPAADPFFGRTRVAPPATGCIAPGPVDPYFRGPPPAVTPPMVTPGTSVPGPITPVVPYGVVPPGTGATNTVPSGTSTAQVASSGTLAGRERVVRIIQPRPKTSVAIDIMDLPAAGASPSRNAASKDSTASGFRLVSATEPIISDSTADFVQPTSAASHSTTKTVEDTPTGFTPQPNYGHNPDYKQLRGKLEYSQIDRRWKLRYIPIDGRTDRYGGSVVLTDTSLLSGCERGDFIEVHGQIGRHDPKRGFAPTYQADEVKRL